MILHIVAHENPLYTFRNKRQMLGHCDTRLLFDVYVPYVTNASRTDGKAFDSFDERASNDLKFNKKKP